MLPLLLIPFIGTLLVLLYIPLKLMGVIGKTIATSEEVAKFQDYKHDTRKTTTYTDGTTSTTTYNQAEHDASTSFIILCVIGLATFVFIVGPVWITFKYLWSFVEVRYSLVVFGLAGLLFLRWYQTDKSEIDSENPSTIFSYFWVFLAVISWVLAWRFSAELYDRHLYNFFLMNRYVACALLWTTFFFPFINCLNLVLLHTWKRLRGKRKGLLKLVLWLLVLATVVVLCCAGYAMYMAYINRFPDGNVLMLIEMIVQRLTETMM